MLPKLALRNLWRNPRRSAVALFTIAIGVMSLLLFQGFNAGILEGNRDHTIHSKYGHGQVNTAGYRAKLFEKPWEHWIQDPAPVIGALKSNPAISHVMPRVEFFAMMTTGNVSVAGRGIGIDGRTESKFFKTLNYVEGGNLGDHDEGIVLGYGLAQTLNAHVGDHVTVLGSTVRGSMNGLELEVVGIFHIGLREIDDAVFHVPLLKAQELLDTQAIEKISLGLADGSSWDDAATAIIGANPNLEATPFNVLDKVWYQQTVDWLTEQFKVIRLIIISIILLGVFNTASSSILERTREFGILAANGESFRDLMSLIALEGVYFGIFGVMIGVLITFVLKQTFLAHGVPMPPAPGYTVETAVNFIMNSQLVFSSAVTVMAVCVMATSFAGLKVARMSITAALRAT